MIRPMVLNSWLFLLVTIQSGIHNIKARRRLNYLIAHTATDSYTEFNHRKFSSLIDKSLKEERSIFKSESIDNLSSHSSDITFRIAWILVQYYRT